MDAFPAFIPLAGRTVAIVGEGEGAQAKARLFEGSPAILLWLNGAQALTPAAYAGVALAFIDGPEAFAAAAADAARRAGVLVNVVDKPRLSDFQTPSIIDRGAVVGAIGTGGAAPVLASQLRSAIEAQWPDGLGRVAELLRALQPEIRAALPDLDRRRAYLRDQIGGPSGAAAANGQPELAITLAREALISPPSRQGVVWDLEQPASADLISIRALRVLGRVDRIVAGSDADPALLALARRDARRFRLEEAPQSVIADWALTGLEVVHIRSPEQAGADWETARGLGADVRPLT